MEGEDYLHCPANRVFETDSGNSRDDWVVILIGVCFKNQRNLFGNRGSRTTRLNNKEPSGIVYLVYGFS
jgi:hypothetical protein